MSGVLHSPLGWPYFADDGDIPLLPAYTRELRDKLETSDANAAGAANSATQSAASATAAEQARTAAQQAVTDAQQAVADAKAATPTDSGWVAVTGLLNGWGAVGGYPLQIRRIGKQRFIRGMATQSNVANFAKPIATLAAGDFDPSQSVWLSAVVNAGGTVAQLNLQAGGNIQFIAGYTSGTVTTGAYPVSGSWMLP